MSHYAVMVIGPKDDDELSKTLEPFDENIEFMPYKDYNIYFPEVIKTDKGKKAWVAEQDDIFEDENGKFFEWSTYNPNSKWDWYAVGGRWDGFLRLKSGINANRAYFKDIDFETKKELEAIQANKLYDRWEILLEEIGDVPVFSPPKKSDTVSHEAYTALRQAYVKVYNEHPAVSRFKKEFYFMSVEDFSVSREEFVSVTSQQSILAFATLTEDGEWLEPGEMGWFGMSTDTLEDQKLYAEKVNKILESLNPETTITIVDCHI